MTAFASGGWERMATAMSRAITPRRVGCVARACDDGLDTRGQVESALTWSSGPQRTST